MTYIALLRGINVGGHRVTMERLRALFTELGLRHVRSYIQSGNIFFEAPETEDRAALTRRIEEHLRQALGYEVPAFLRTVPEFEQLLALNPFAPLTLTDNMRLCVMLLTDAAPTDLALPLRSPKQDYELLHVTPSREAFVIWHLLDGRVSSSTAFLDKLLGKRTTTRFYPTALKILAAAKAA
ncbi:DUF1697 domain-containing protein [Hymenobacter gummosus]|uniref:DUF1697 domain-containing protein n=1 Tax=Hymenobacter gummosus TaxID=1776032 RepID=A0A431U6R9_9BACT|nr:DUF1697 domain-containing protein [Hymenobacter gummosus]RTQ52336.1 DUF1697 domain-containing protein [Hymenobacter gummosus]